MGQGIEHSSSFNSKNCLVSEPYEAIHIVHSENFSKNYHFLNPDTHMYVCESGGKTC